MTTWMVLIGQNPQGGAPQSPLIVFFPYLLILAIFYFLLIRPQQKRAAEHQKLIERLKNGDKVITESGLFGTVVSVHEDSVILKVADNVKLRFLKTKVSAMQPSAGPAKKKTSGKKKS